MNKVDLVNEIVSDQRFWRMYEISKGKDSKKVIFGGSIKGDG